MASSLARFILIGLAVLTLVTLSKGDKWSDILAPQEDTNTRTYFDWLAEASKSKEQARKFEHFSVPTELKRLWKAFYTTLLDPTDSFGTESKSSFEGRPAGSDDLVYAMNSLMSALYAVAANNQSVMSTCVNDTGRLLTSLFSSSNETKWAKLFLDAAGKPGPALSTGRFNLVGDYKLCRSLSAPSDESGKGFKGNYCVLKATVGQAQLSLNPLMLQLGACMPDTCSEMELTIFVAEAFEALGLNKTLVPLMAECHTDEREATAATTVAIVILCIIGLLMVGGTALDILYYQWPKWQEKRAEENGLVTNVYDPRPNGYSQIEGDTGVTSDETSSLLGKPGEIKHMQSVCSKILLAFSVYSNGSKVLNTYQPPGSLGAIHGIRFLSMTWVILGHTYVFGIAYFSNLGSQFIPFLKRWSFDPVSNAFLSVDTFFTLSGLLTAYLTMKEMKKKGWKLNWGLFYFHRFWRLTPPYMLTLLLVLGFQQYLGAGALWSNVQPQDKTNCEKYWWANLLYVNNLIDTQKMCFGHSWYLSNDMQFFVISPLMLLPLYFHKYTGLLTCLGFCLITWITTGVLSTQKEWSGTLISANPNAGANFLSYMEGYYVKPYTRLGPYVVGLVAGYWLSKYHGKVRLNRATVIIGWVVATAVALASLYGLHGEISGEDPNTVGADAFYNAMGRSAWGACVCWVIVACASGYGGPVNKILSWSPFVALGRMTYMAYLIHPCLIYIFYQNQDQLYYLNDTNIVVSFCGIIVVTFMVAFVLMLGLESPMIGLEKALLHKNRKE